MAIYKLHNFRNCYWIKKRWRYFILCYKSLTFNTFDSTAEAAFEPLYCFVDFVVRWFGVAFVIVVIGLMSSVVIIFYATVLPVVYESYSPLYALLHLSYGHYLLIMISFHYYKAVRTNPGVPPSDPTGVAISSICKKCCISRPARAHHCSVCKCCRLKMDHHCPWLNNCVGHFNHRYFISFCVFMCLGTIYVSCSSWVIFKDCFHVTTKVDHAMKYVSNIVGRDFAPKDTTAVIPENVQVNMCSYKSRVHNNSIVYLWILCSAVTVALGGLTSWHVFLISRGETCIEKLLNQSTRKRLARLKQKFVNPYDFGVVENWKEMLGFHNFKSFVKRVLLPSSHLPRGNGLVWNLNRQHSFVT